MIALIIIGVIILLILILLFLPISLDFAYDKEFRLKVKYFGITLFDTNGKEKTDTKTQKKKKIKSKKSDKLPPKKENFIKRTYKQRGLAGTVKYFCDILGIAVKKAKPFVKRLKFKDFNLDIVVATNDAADTAIQYGRICTAVYPVISFLQSVTNLKVENINVGTNFNNTKSSFKISGIIQSRLIYVLTTAISFIIEFLKFERKEREENERKQSKKRNGHHTGKPKNNG